ncbi:hypothetical protein BgiMline_019781 [Biomphalaria glabrata]|nr:proteoglycan 4-like [Biomphalaria glabrata]KAI8750626.1 proteoglycan 4 [Biomphalaria glabrata]
MSQLKYLNKEISTNKTIRKDPPPPPVAITSQKDEHRYEEVAVGQKEENLYDKLVYTEDAKEISTRLQSIEDNQEKMAAEFRSHYQFLISEIKKLQDALEGVKTSNINLQKSLVESSTVVQESVESLKSQFLETSDHLGQHVLQVRKDIVALSKRDPNSPPPISGFESPSHHGATDTRVKHMFEWDIQSVDNLVKTQGHVSSHSYHIGDLNYKVLGGAEFLKDSIMSVRIYGESTHPSGTDHLTKSGRFECKVMVIDRSGAMTDWLIGKVVGNFFKEKMWMVGNVSVPELKKKNYLAQNKTLKLKFTIDIFK